MSRIGEKWGEWVAVRRTVAPAVWAWIVGIFAEWGLDVTEWVGDKPVTISALTVVLAGVIYVGARLLGKRWPWVEAFVLTSGKQPTYGGADAVG